MKRSTLQRTRAENQVFHRLPRINNASKYIALALIAEKQLDSGALAVTILGMVVRRPRLSL
jgi:hypothetical protein